MCVDGVIDERACDERARAIAADPARSAVCRERLGSLSWFMRCLCEPIARRANREGDCRVRFWEGLYRCQALLDDQAVLACMAYVDLNPIRAGMCDSLEGSVHTSIPGRMAECSRQPDAAPPMAPVAGLATTEGPALTTAEHLAVVDWTGRLVHPTKRGQIDRPPPVALLRASPNADRWTQSVLGIETDYRQAVGAVDALLAKAQAMGQCWLQGLGVARSLGRKVRAV